MSRDLWEAKEYIPTVTSLDEAFSLLSFSQYEDLGLPIDLADIVGSLDLHQEWFESLETLDKALTLDSVGALPIETQWVLEAEMKIKGRVKTMSGKPHKPRKLIRDKNITPEDASKKLKFEASGTTYLWVDWRDGKVQVAANRPTPTSMHVCWVYTPDSPTPFQSTMEGLSNWLLLTGKTIPANLIRSPTELDMFLTTTTANTAKGAAQELEDCDWPYLLVDDGLPGMIKFSYDDNLTDYAEDPNNWVIIDSGTQKPVAPPPKPCPGPGPCPPPVPVSPMPSPGPLSNLFDAEYREEEVLWKQDFHSMIYTGSDKIFFAFRTEEPGVVYTIEQMSVNNQPMCRILHIWEPYSENDTPYDSYIQKLIIDHDLLNAEPDDSEPESWSDPTEPWMEEFEAPEGICLFCDETEGLEVINLDGWPEELCETCRDPEQYLAEEKMCHKCGHSIFTECVGCSNDICDECLQPQHLTTASGGEAFDSRVGWMCCPECYDENVDVEYTVRKDADAESFDTKTWEDDDKVQECVNLWHNKEHANEDNEEEQMDYWSDLFMEKYDLLSEDDKQKVDDDLEQSGMAAESFAAEVIKKCQRCGGKAKMTWVQAKCSDLYDQVNLNTGKEYDGYVPDWIGISGDYVSFTICRHCGQVQGAWPELDATMNQFKSGKANTSSIFEAESFAAYQLYHGRIIGNYTVSWWDFDENEGSAEFEDFNDALKYAEDLMKNPLTYVLDPNHSTDTRHWKAQEQLHLDSKEDRRQRHHPQEIWIFSNKTLEGHLREGVGGPPMVGKRFQLNAESFSATTSPAGTKGSGMSRLKADAIINKVKAHMGPHLDFIEVCGSYRRGNPTPKDLDFVVIPKKGVTLPNILPPNQGVNWVGDKKAQVVIDNETIDFRVSSLTGLGASLMYFTGPAGYNIGMRMRAKKMGLKLNEYGVFDRNTGAYIAGATEADVYQALGKPYKSPDLRGK